MSSSSSTSSALTDASPQQHANTTSNNNHQGAPSLTDTSPSYSQQHGASNTNNPPPSWLNRVLYVFDQESGTHEILQLKNKVNESSAAFDDAQRKVAAARTTLDKALQTYEESQAQHNQLLQTRDKWAPSQALEFAKLLEKESTIRNEMELAKKNLSLLESQQAGSMHTYMNQLRSRYQEEQLWQDKWRIYSTYMTWGLIFFNSVVFFIGQYFHYMRENKRMLDIKELLQQSLAANLATSRAIQMQNRDTQLVVVEDRKEDKEQDRAPSDQEQQHDESEEEANDVAVIVAEEDEEDNKSQLEEGTSPLMIHWIRIQQYILSKKILENVDLPSAIIGASVTGVLWIVTATISTREGSK